MPATPTAALTVAIAAVFLSGCLGGEAEPAPLTVIAEAYDKDKDGAAEVVLDLYFTKAGKNGVRIDATGDLHLAAAAGDAHTQDVEFEPIGAVRFEINKTDSHWVDTKEHGAIYRHVLNDHHFEPGTSYLFSLELHDGPARYASKAQIYYP